MKYEVTLSSDQGKHKKIAFATNISTLVRQVCDWELCPESAIINIKQLKTK